ncbi:hypothetical protein [Pseudomonas viridiflava]|uniref:hypothetical protein n=1 Tax=Pseudomonas viridiflava TaxID=33069 RepID=UPI000F01C5CA|nr:hypothetical protein [Pseudomonas viridiflava]
MTKEYELSPEQAIYQLTNAVLALSHVLAKVSPELTQGYLAVAAEASKQKGFGSDLIDEIYQTAFPDAKPSVVLSSEEFDKRFGKN